MVRFANGTCEHVAIFRNPQADDGGWGDLPTLPERGWAGSIDNSQLEKEAPIRVEWSAARATYDVRGKRELGEVAKVEAVLDPWSPVVLTRTPSPIPPLRVEVPGQVQVGEVVAVTLRDEAPLPAGTIRVVRLELVGPEGNTYEVYSRNVRVESTPHREDFHLAYNDPRGPWQLKALDVATGRGVQASFTLGA